MVEIVYVGCPGVARSEVTRSIAHLWQVVIEQTGTWLGDDKWVDGAPSCSCLAFRSAKAPYGEVNRLLRQPPQTYSS